VGTAALAAAAVAIVATSGGNGTQPDILLHGPTGIASSAVPAPATRGSASSGSAAAPTFISPDAPPRRVERAADLTIATSVGRLQDTADGVPAIADRLGGFVAQSDVSIAGDGGQATFDLRIPAGRLDEALTAISRLGHVRARSQQNTDVTGSYSAAQARLHDARAERGALLRALAAATTQPQIDSIQARLRIARGRIAAAQHAVSALRRASDLASVSVTVIGVAQGAGAPGPGGGHHPWTPGRALHDAVAVLSAAAGVAIVAVAAALPTAVVALLAALGWRAVRRRRREQALDLRSPAV
jgi:hypothetical protein